MSGGRLWSLTGRLWSPTGDKCLQKMSEWPPIQSPGYGDITNPCTKGESQWPRGLRRGSEAAGFLVFRFRILPAAWMPVSCVCVVCFQVEVSASGWSLVQRSPTECGVSECYRVASIVRMPWLLRLGNVLKGMVFFFFVFASRTRGIHLRCTAA